MNLGAALKSLRLGTVYNQKRLAEKIGVTQTYVSLMEKGVKTPSMDIIEKYAEVTGRPVAVILWMATTENEVPPNKKSAFKILKPAIDGLIKEIFN